ncbi:hypothetical protein D8674_028196 [Pyrus ussuriensis x Pyrus communis]|uniref:Uncharacterized protein n=1 Tax=Pyrus ussuriensis x Pyrus communis TaxID=2448454 RepID=A0A5N5HWF4_9ROSA|nr:hypothetical protein D8674_028196 [Pyrus ussuriensis x Pyrus communis]
MGSSCQFFKCSWRMTPRLGHAVRSDSQKPVGIAWWATRVGWIAKTGRVTVEGWTAGVGWAVEAHLCWASFLLGAAWASCCMAAAAGVWAWVAEVATSWAAFRASASWAIA